MSYLFLFTVINSIKSENEFFLIRNKYPDCMSFALDWKNFRFDYTKNNRPFDRLDQKVDRHRNLECYKNCILLSNS